MKKSTLVAMLAVGIVLSGVGMGVVAHIWAPEGKAEAAMLPSAATWLPASSDLVAYIDLVSILSSPIREEWESSRPGGFEEVEKFREATGMDPWTDFHALSFSTTTSTKGETQDWGLVLVGDFDPEKLLSSIEERQNLERGHYLDTELFTFRNETAEKSEEPVVLAFPEPTTALFGTTQQVEAMLDVGAGRKASAVEGPLAHWIEQIPLDDTFWCAGSAEGHLSRVLDQGHGATPNIPPLQSFAISGTLDSYFSMNARGEASDPEAAQKLTDVLRGFIALGSLQQQDRPELQAILDSISIETTENRVGVSLAIPYETLRRLVAPTEE